MEDAAIGTFRVFKFGLKNVNHMAYAVRDEGTEWVCDCLNTELRLPHDERWFRCELFPNYVRLVRAQVLTLSEAEYIEAARAGGSSSLRIILSHIIPNSVGVIIVNTTLNVAKIILYESTLSYLGLGMPPPAPEWGQMLAEAREFMRNAPHLLIFPAVAIVLTACAINLVGDGLRDALDPQLKS